MKFKDIFTIEKISYKTAMDIIIAHHYLHRRCPCSFSYGLFQDNQIVGVICYGTPSSAPLRMGICGIEEAKNVIELTRLWIKDGLPTNSASFLIGNTIKLIDKEIVVSYAEINQGHIGVVYQATNWIYTGLSAKRTDWKIKGVDRHCQTIADKYSADELRQKYGDNFYLQKRGQKHRYIFFNCNSKRKKELLKKLKYKISNYPK